MAVKNQDITNQRFGHLVALHPSQRKHDSQYPYWTCKCDCGNISDTIIYSLIKGATTSCGCKFGVKAKTNRHKSALNKVYSDYKHKAKIRKIEWNLSKEEVIDLVSKNCNYCGLPPSNTVKVHTMKNTTTKYSGIDRVDPSKGYAITNCVPSCAQCNYAKLGMNGVQFANWVKSIYGHLFSNET